MIKYEITRWSSLLAERAMDHTVKHRSDAAVTTAYRMIWEMLAGEGLLDRPIAQQIVAQFNQAEISPPPRGYRRRHVFRVSEYGGWVEVFITRH